MAYDQARTGARQGQDFVVWRFFGIATKIAHWQSGAPPRAPATRGPGGVMGQTLHVGNPTVVEAFADRTPFGAVFEDDGKVAYFYGLDTRLGDNPIVDSVCVYNVSELLTRPIGRARRARAVRCGARVVAGPASGRAAAESLSARGVRLREQARVLPQQLPARVGWSASGHAWDDRAVIS